MTDLFAAIQIVKQGGIIIYPTDTAFGIGCRIDRPSSVDRLFDLRKRIRTKATPVLVSSQEMALAYFDRPKNIVRHFMQQYWPGALTIVSAANKDLVYSPIRGGGNSIGLRMPNHETALSLLRGVGVPIIGTSANFSGEQTPFLYEDLEPELLALVDAVVYGTCIVKTASTVVDCTVDPYKIIRQGAVVV